MLKRILVPLDGSARAEGALPTAAQIVRKNGGTLILLQVSTLGVEYGPYLTLAEIKRESIIKYDLANANAYLDSIIQRPELADITVRKAALPGFAATTILSYAQTHQIDLIVLPSHGYTKFKRWLLGSVASHIAHHSSVPTLILHEHDRQTELISQQTTGPFTALIALDGSPAAETVIEPVAHIVAALSSPGQGNLHLTRLVKLPTFKENAEYQDMGINVDFLRQQAVTAAGKYLQSVTDMLTNDGLATQLNLHVTWTTEECRDIAETLIKMAERTDASKQPATCHLLALATHGWGGVQRLMLGSVADNVLTGTSLPLLIVRPSQSSVSTITQEKQSQQKEHIHH
jgi:nucleotide-binding universal stress UspA family protein